MKFTVFKHEIQVSRLALLLILCFWGALFGFYILGHEIVVENEDWFDTRVFQFFHSHSPHGLVTFFKDITFFGSIPFLLPAYVVIAAILFFRKQKADAICTAVIGLLSTALIFTLKNIYARDRPDLPLFAKATNYSFPSGHSLSSAVFFAVLISLVWESKFSKPIRIILTVCLILLTLLIGISRIILRYHYATDVIAGFCLGIACVIFFFWLRKKLRVYEKGRKIKVVQ